MKPIAYVFGYGSLMYPSGINGRGMKYKYTWKDLHHAEIIDYRRGMFAAYCHQAYYGIMKAPGKVTNGVLIPIFSKKDLNALWLNEGAHACYRNTKQGLLYEVHEVSDNIYVFDKYRDTRFHTVFTLVSITDKSKEGIIPPWYVADVWKGIKPWGESFRHRFINTGGIEPSCAAKIVAPIYGLCKSARYIWRNIFKIN